jgi:arsenite methyltransferase
MESEKQAQTSNTFDYKWKKRDTYESDAMQAFAKEWLKSRYQVAGKTLADLVKGKRVLDAGCGAGHSAILLFDDLLNQCEYWGVDISGAVDVAAQRFKERALKGQFLQTSLTNLPDKLGNFDVIFSEGVLHHTDSTHNAVKYLSGRLNKGGLLMFYIYKVKAPVREFVDDYIREKIAPLSNDAAWEALMPLTELGKILGELNVDVEIKKPIDLLEIPAGKVNLQRLFYWYFGKVFYRPDLSLEEMNHINFDWYRPKNCHRHTEPEVRTWLKDLGLEVLTFKTEEAGMTVIAQKSH